MVHLTVCLACQVGRCEGCVQGETREGLIGGWRCICEHDEETARERRENVQQMLTYEHASTEHDAGFDAIRDDLSNLYRFIENLETENPEEERERQRQLDHLRQAMLKLAGTGRP